MLAVLSGSVLADKYEGRKKCSSCHKSQGESWGTTAHAKAAHKKMETEGATCIDCHQNLVHKAVAETDLNASRTQKKMVLKEVKADPDEEEE